MVDKMLTTKITLAIAAMFAIVYQPAIAETTDIMGPLDPFTQAGAFGVICFMLWWQMAKIGPAESKRRSDDLDRISKRRSEDLDRMLNIHNDSAKVICADIQTMTSDVRSMREGTIKLNETLKGRPCMMDKQHLQAVLKES